MNTWYYLVDQTGAIKGWGNCPDTSLVKIPDGQQLVVGAIGVKPNPQTDLWDFTTSTLKQNAVTPPVNLPLLRNRQVRTLSDACQRVIEAGFQSSALGSVGSYGSNKTDQLNILHAASSATGGCLRVGAADWTGDWPLMQHTQAQAQQVHSDFLTACTAARQKLAALSAQVNAATTADAIAAITW